MFQPVRGEKLKSSERVQAVRDSGKSFANALVVLIAASNSLPYSRFAVIASRKVGGAVKRNRCKRVLRARIARLLPEMYAGFDFLLIARPPLPDATPEEIDRSVRDVFMRSGLLRADDETS